MANDYNCSCLDDPKDANGNGNQEADPSKPSDQQPPRTDNEVKLENCLLKNQLSELREAVEHNMKKMDGPLMQQIQSETFKRNQMEEKLGEIQRATVLMQESLEKEINQLKLQLCFENSQQYKLSELNERLNDEVACWTQRCIEAEFDLQRQRLSDGVTLHRLREEVNRLRRELCCLPQKDSCDLYEVARDLSETLKACAPCEKCGPAFELQETVKCIKELTDLVSNFPSQLPCAEEDAPGGSCVCGDDAKKSKCC